MHAVRPFLATSTLAASYSDRLHTKLDSRLPSNAMRSKHPAATSLDDGLSGFLVAFVGLGIEMEAACSRRPSRAPLVLHARAPSRLDLADRRHANRESDSQPGNLLGPQDDDRVRAGDSQDLRFGEYVLREVAC